MHSIRYDYFLEITPKSLFTNATHFFSIPTKMFKRMLHETRHMLFNLNVRTYEKKKLKNKEINSSTKRFFSVKFMDV